MDEVKEPLYFRFNSEKFLPENAQKLGAQVGRVAKRYAERLAKKYKIVRVIISYGWLDFANDVRCAQIKFYCQ